MTKRSSLPVFRAFPSGSAVFVKSRLALYAESEAERFAVVVFFAARLFVVLGARFLVAILPSPGQRDHRYTSEDDARADDGSPGDRFAREGPAEQDSDGGIHVRVRARLGGRGLAQH